MTLARFLAGIPLSLIALIPIGLAAGAVRRLLLPEWRGVEARLVEIVLALAAITVVTEALGTVGWFAPLPVILGLALTGCAGWILARRQLDQRGAERLDVADDGRAPGHDSAAGPWWPPAAAAAGIFLVTGAWLARTIRSIEHGMITVDTFWYHLPVAVRFVQTGHITSVQYLDQDPTTAFYPATSSLLHGIGILLFRTDLLSTAINLGWLALALAAAWSAGRSFGVAPATTLGVAIVLGTPGLVATEPGGAYNDIAGLALLVTAMAIVVHNRTAPRTTTQDAAAGLAAGLAIGMKFIFILPAAALCLGLVLTTPKGSRARHGILVVVCAGVTGGYWYVRNAVATGNPLPSLAVHIGPLALPSVKALVPTSTVATFLFDGWAWSDYFIPGFRSSLGPAWIAVLAFALTGSLVAAAQRSERRVRMLGLFGLFSMVAFLVTPQNLVGGFGRRPVLFVAQVRLATPALAIGLVLLPIALRRWSKSVAAAYLLALVVTQLDPTSWPTGFRWGSYFDRVSGDDAARAIVLLLVVSALVVAAIKARRRVPALRSGKSVAGLAIPVGLLLGLACVHGRYLDGRYIDTPPFPKLFAWPRGIHDSRIALVGAYMQGQYPFAGLDLSNHVQYAGVRTRDGGFRPFRSCLEWVKFLETGRYNYVVIGLIRDIPRWTAAQPDARLKVTESVGSPGVVVVEVFRLDPDRSPRSC